MNWIPFMQPKQKKQFNLNNTYILIEFLTEDQKIQKNRIIKELQKEFADDIQIIIPYSTAFKYSFRYILNTAEVNPSLVNKIKLQQILALVQATTNKELSDFLETQSEKFKLYFHNGNSIHGDEIIPLYNQRDISAYEPTQVLQIIYTKKSFMQRMKLQSIKFVTNIPKKMTNLFIWLFTKILQAFGIRIGKDLFMKLMPIKSLLNYFFGFLIIFFPALAPIIGIGKAFL